MATDDRASLSIDIKDIKRLQASFDKKGKSLKMARSTFGKAVVLIDRWVQKNFQTEGRLAYPGVGWKPLSESTIAARLRMKRTQRATKGKAVAKIKLPILQVNGWLRSRWRHFYNDQYAMIQSGVDYGIYHDSDKPRKKLPERKITPKEKQIMPELKKIFGDHVRTSLDKK